MNRTKQVSTVGREGIRGRYPRHASLSLALAASGLVLGLFLSLLSPAVLTPLSRSAQDLPPMRHGVDRALSVALARDTAEACTPGPGCSGSGKPAARSLVAMPVWTNLSGPQSPPGRYRTSMVYDWRDHEVLLFGGTGQHGWDGNLNGTWVYRAGWSNITTEVGTAPVARWGMTMVYDARDGYVLAFGGNGTCNVRLYCHDYWSFEDNHWTELGTSGSPCPTICSLATTYDAADGYVLVSDGSRTWTYAGGTWSGSPSRFCPTCTTAVPGPNVNGSIAYDPAAGYTLLYGEGYTWEYLAGVWTNLSSSLTKEPDVRGLAALTYDNMSKGVLLESEGSQPATWLFSNGSWANVTEFPAPQPAEWDRLIWDGADSIALLFDGNGGLYGAYGNFTWVWGTSPPLAQLRISVDPTVPKPDQPALFSASFRGGVGPDTYSWHFGDGNSSTQAAPAHAYLAGGHYTVSLWVNDSAGHSINTTLRVWIYLPLALSSLTASPNPATLGEPVTFIATVDGGTPPFTYAWAFGDGQTGGNLSQIVHAYSTDGPFEAEVTVQDAIGERVEATVNVSISLDAVAASSSTSGAFPLAVDFTATAQGGVPPFSYQWNFGDGTPVSTVQDPSHTFNRSGSYLVTLTITDSLGHRATSTLTVIVHNAASGAPLPDWVYPALALTSAGLVLVSAAWILDRRRWRSSRSQELRPPT